MLKPVRTVPPAEMPVSLDEAKLHCRVDHNAEDAHITGLIAAAATHLDGWSGILGRALVNSDMVAEIPAASHPAQSSAWRWPRCSRSCRSPTMTPTTYSRP
jgi:hypothetical protein